MLHDAVMEGVTAAEVVALARLAADKAIAPPPHLCPTLRSKGWLTTAEDGSHVLTPTGWKLLERA
jgi:hypothetical protein